MDIYAAIAWLKEHGEEVGNRFQADDPHAARVVEFYRLVYACSSDQAAQTFLCCALEAYIQAHPTRKEAS